MNAQVPAKSERLLSRVSDRELERRWAAARREMRERQIDALVLQGANDWLGGYVRWFTDVPATNGYPRTVIFHADDLMTVIEMGPAGGGRCLSGRDPVHRGVGELLFSPSFLSIAHTHTYDADLAFEVLRRRGYRTIGFVGAGAMPHAFVTRIRSLPNTHFVDATDFVDRLKAIKSEEELSLIRRCAELQDKVFASVLEKIQPGMRDADVTALAQFEGHRLGSEQGIFLGASAPLGVRSPLAPRWMQGRILQRGDHLSLLIENNGPGGFYTEIARTIVLGKASSELKDGFAQVLEAQRLTLARCTPGMACRDLYAAHNQFMMENGLPPEMRLYAHGQGYDMVERPLLRADETMTIAPGMNLAIHPGYETERIFAVVCDNYIIDANGPGECLHRTPKQLFEVY